MRIFWSLRPNSNTHLNNSFICIEIIQILKIISLNNNLKNLNINYLIN